MLHPGDGVLRRLMDEPDAVTVSARRHVDTCGRCQRRQESMAADASNASKLLGTGPSAVEPATALMRLRARSAAGAVPADVAPPRRSAALALRGSLAMGIAAVLVGVLFVSGAAQGALEVLQPQQVQAVRFQPAALKGFPDLGAYGTSDFKQPQVHQFKDAASAQAAAGLAVPSISSSTIALPPVTGYATVDRYTGSFTFDAAKARAAAAAAGKPAAPMPAGLDGTTLYLTGGPGIAEIRGVDPAAAKPQAGSDPATTLAGSKVLVVAVAQPPAATSSGASVDTIKKYLVSLPGVSPELAAQIQAISDPVHTLPIPIPDVQNLQTSTVDLSSGSAKLSGTYVGDNSLHIGGVIWIKSNLVYAVAGTYSQQELTDLARSVAART